MKGNRGIMFLFLGASVFFRFSFFLKNVFSSFYLNAQNNLNWKKKGKKNLLCGHHRAE